jgi:hypothetical protein
MVDNDYYTMGGPENANWRGCPVCWSIRIIIDTTGRFKGREAKCIDCKWSGGWVRKY